MTNYDAYIFKKYVIKDIEIEIKSPEQMRKVVLKELEKDLEKHFVKVSIRVKKKERKNG